MVLVEQGSCINVDDTIETKINFHSHPSSTFMTEKKRVGSSPWPSAEGCGCTGQVPGVSECSCMNINQKSSVKENTCSAKSFPG